MASPVSKSSGAVVILGADRVLSCFRASSSSSPGRRQSGSRPIDSGDLRMRKVRGRATASTRAPANTAPQRQPYVDY